MEYVITTTRENFVKEINKIRLENKNKWIFIDATVDGLEVAIKTYNTYLQRFFVNGMPMHSGVMEMSVTQWKKELEEGIQ